MILSIINVFLLIIITFSSVSLSFARNENRSVGTIRHIIINPLQALFYARTIFSTLNALLEIKDYRKLFCYILFLGSFLIFLFFLIEEQYIYSKEIERTFYLISSLIFSISCCFLLLGTIFQNKNIYGLFNGFIVSSIIGVFGIISYVKSFKIITLKEEFNNYPDYKIYLQLHILLHSIKDKNINREEMMKFIKYNEFSINESKNFWNEQKKEYALLLKVESLLKKYINYRPKSLILKIGLYKLLYFYLEKYKGAYIIIYNLYEDICEGNINASIGEKFYVFRIKKVLEEKAFNSAIDKTEISIRYQINKFKKKISIVVESYYLFWELLINASQNKDLEKLNQIGYNIAQLVNEIKHQFEKIKTMKLKDKKIYALYGYYLRDVLNESEYNNELNEITKGLSDNYSKIFNGVNLNDIHTSSNFHFILVSAKSNSFGKIEKISPEIAKILKYETNQLIGKQIDILLPFFIIEEHDKYIRNYIEINSDFKYNFFKKKPFNLRSKNKFLETIALNITIHLDEDSFPFIFAQVNEEEQLIVNKENSNTSYIVTNEFFIIQNFTSNAIQILQLGTYVLDDFTEITPFIKEFNEEIHAAFAQNNFLNTIANINCIKLNIIKNHFINIEGEKIICWTINNHYFSLNVSEIVINEKLIGFIFKFKQSNNQNNKNLKITILQGRNSIASAQSKGNENENKINSELTELISSSYIPNNFENFDFDINKKEFLLFKNKYKKKKENFEEIEDYFQKKYINMRKRNSELNEEDDDDEEENDEEEEDDFDDDDDEDDEEINKKHLNYLNSNISENENHNILTKLSRKSNSNNIIYNSNSNYSYYNINLKNITLFVYNYKTLVVDVFKGYIYESKVDEIFRKERLLSDAIQKKKNTGLNLDQNDNNKIYHKGKNKYNNKKININYSNKFNIPNKPKVSKNILGLIFIILLNLLGFTILILIAFSKILSAQNDIINLIEIQNYLSDLMINGNNAFYFSYQLIALQKSLYYNYNPLKETLENQYEENLKDIYNSILDLIKSILLFYPSMNNSNRKLLDNIKVNYCTLTYTTFDKNCTDGYIFNFLEEFSFALFSFYCTNKKELNFTNIFFNFIFINYESLLLENLEDFQRIFINEYNSRMEYLKQGLIVLIVCLIILEIIIVFGLIKVNSNVKKEEHKTFEIFFRINPQYILNAINRCEKFIELNNEFDSGPNHLVSNPIINIKKITSNNDEVITENENSPLIENNLANVQKKWEKNKNKIKLFEKGQIEYNFLTKFIFLFILILSVFIIINIYARLKYKLISNYVKLYLYIIYHQSYFVKLFNYYRTYLIFSYYRYSDGKINFIYNALHSELSKAFEENSKYYDEIMTTVSILNNEGQNLLKNYYNNDIICKYFSDYGKEYNKTCSQVADNIANYGLWFTFNHAIQFLNYLTKEIDALLEIGESKGYKYNEILYDSGIKNDLYPNNVSLYEDYLKYNPFNVINSNITLNLTVLTENIIIPSIDGLRIEISNMMIRICDDIEKYSFICIFLLFFFLISYYIFLLIPKVIKTNSEINQGKVMLKIIPKNERDKIKKSLDRNFSM